MTAFPDGLHEDHVSARNPLARHASPLSLLLLGLLVAAAAFGLLGGMKSPVSIADAPAVRLEVKKPALIRNGEFFETRITVMPKRAIADLVVGVEPSLWRDLTVNTFMPGAAEEKYEDGAFRFSYGPAAAGKPLEIKLDSQINPSLWRGTAGEVFVADGDEKLATLDLSMRVLP